MVEVHVVVHRFVLCVLLYAHAINTATDRMMRAAQFEKGGPENLYVAEVARPALGERQVLIKVHASAINRADTLQRKGLYPPPPGESDILGLEAAGVVDSLGPGCSEKWKIGDRVMSLLSGGGNSEYVATPEQLLMAIPEGMDYIQAAAIPEVWLTAYQLLHFVGKVQSGETVLIHGGASGVGTAAVQLVSLAGAKSIVTAGSEAKIATAVSLGASQGFNYKEGDFSQKVRDATNGKGVDVILDCVGGSYYEQNMNVIAVDGRWVLYGLMGGGNISGDVFAKLLRKRVSVTGTTLRARSLEYKTKLVGSFMQDVLHHFISGKVKPIVFTTFPLEKIGDAHKMMEENKNTGKIVIEVNQDRDKKDEL
ncbi:quinone oxidoreductase PIG3-like [Haliotis rubra]|uniref:quinone oxidoreductase PIG3-like n=1 Tax=Haliotis rubra TaxID=36100 RepID=UPI001EE4F7D6|nr:quinone oxidoreductase PIG3-like [Haliotis rubra]